MSPRKQLDVAHYKNQLEELRKDTAVRLKKLEDRIAGRLPSEGDDTPAGHEDDPSDLASDSLEKERELMERDSLKDTLEQVEMALERIERGTYGKCALCGQEIDPARLEAVPYALYCFKCQNKLESG